MIRSSLRVTVASKRRDQIRKHVRQPVEVPGYEVRVIKYQVIKYQFTDRHQPDAEPQTYRLVTTLLDPGTTATP